MLDDGDDSTQLIRDPLFRTRFHQPFHGFQRGDFGSPSFRFVQGLAQHFQDHSCSLCGTSFDQGVDGTVDGTSDGLTFVHCQTEQHGDERVEDTLGTCAEGFTQSLDQDRS